MASSSQPTLPEALICFCVRAAEGVNRTEYKLFSASWVGVGGHGGTGPPLAFPSCLYIQPTVPTVPRQRRDRK